MESWEFLLQKEGDRAWLPLESPDVEILEGRYRVVVRSSCLNTNVEVRITHQPSGETPLQRRTQKRVTRTNSEGLMVVIPYTSLQAGRWELSCTAEAESGAVASPSQGTVLLQVLPTEIEEDFSEQLEPDGQPTAESEVSSQTNLDLEPAHSTIEEAEPASQVVEVPVFPPIITAPLEELVASGPEQEEPLSPASPPVPFPLQMTLEQETFVAQVGQALTLYGRVEVPLTPQSPQPTTSDPTENLTQFIRSANLQVRLRDPQTSRLLLDSRQPMPEQVPPWIFACTLYIPAEWNTRLVLGEVAFCNGTTAIASRTFTIMAEVKQILEAIEEDFSEVTYQLQPVAPTFSQADASKRSFLSLVETLKNKPASDLQQQPLPPQLTTRSSGTTPHSLELPTFDASKSERGTTRSRRGLAAVPDPPSLNSASQQEPSEIVSSQGVTGFTDLLEQSTSATSTPSAIGNPTEGPTASEVEASSKPPEPEIPATESTSSIGFQALKLQERFWSRLNSLANDDELSEWLKMTLPSAEETPGESNLAELESSQEQADSPSPSTPTGSQPLDWEAQEVVVEDDEAIASSTRQPVEATLSTHQPIPYVLPEKELVPMPVLEIAGQDAVAGRRAKVRVRLPELLPRIYVKLWVYDRQTYVILDGPRWLTEFAPDGLGQMEATAELEISPGCMEVEFEAIAVEMQTQRESHKVTVYRRVVPPPAPTLLLEED
ncbi:MAG: hypothetical protein ACM37W_12595 [Actinomycetota bacterium]